MTHLDEQRDRPQSSAPTLVGLAAVALLVAGLFAGFSTVTVEGRDCGSAFVAADQPELRNLPAECEDRRGDRRPVAVGLLVGGGALGIWSLGQANPRAGSRTTEPRGQQGPA